MNIAMPLQRSTSDNNHSFAIVFDKEFHIEPEYLDNEEIKHELRLRNELAGGDRRVISGRLRACLTNERRSPGAHAFFSVGTPPEEFQKCSTGLDRLKVLLQQVTLDPITHERFMSIFLHYEGRLNRIIKRANHLDLTDLIFQKNEQFSELYNEFVQRVRLLRNPVRLANENPSVHNMTENVASAHPIGAATQVQSNAQLQRVNSQNGNPSASQVPSAAHTLILNRVGPNAQNETVDTNGRPNMNIQAQNEAPRNSVRSENNPRIIDFLLPNELSRSNIQDVQRTNRWGQTFAHHRRGMNPNARGGRSIRTGTRQNEQISPLEVLNSDNVDIYHDPSGHLNPSTITNEYSHTNPYINDEGWALLQLLGGTNQVPRHANATMNSGDQARLSEQFQQNNGSLLTPIAIDNENSRSFPLLPNNSNTYDISQGQSVPQHVPIENGSLQITIPPSNFGENRVNSLPHDFGRRDDQRNSHMFNATHPHSVHGTNAYRTYAPNSSLFQQFSGIPTVNDQLPNAATIQQPRVYQSAQNTNNRLFENGTNNNIQTARHVDHTEEKLELILASLASLASEINSIRQWKNSCESNNVNTNAPNNFMANPSATDTVNGNPEMYNERQASEPYNFPSMPSTNQPVVTNTIPRATNDTVFSSFRGTSNFVPIHKWNWKFSADKSSDVPERRDLAAFLKKLELYREAENLTHEQIHQKFHFLIEGCVYEWYMQYRHNFANWQQLLDGLKKQFTTPLTHFMKVAKLAARRQRKDETAMVYIAAIQREFDELGMYSEEEKISIIQNGLNDRLRNVALSHDWNTVQAMDLHLRTIEVADELRKETESQATKRPFFFRRAVNAVEANAHYDMEEFQVDQDEQVNDDESEANGEVECHAVMAKQQLGPNRNKGGMYRKSTDQNEKRETNITSNESKEVRKATCFNCKSEQHRLVDCGDPINRIFCFRCGKEGIRAPNCSCGPKNSKNVACTKTETCD